MTRTSLTLILLLVAAVLTTYAAEAQQHPVGGLRISDETGEAMGQLPAPPGEKHFHLDSGVESFHIAFDFQATEPTQVQLRVLGAQGAILFQDVQTYESPGTQVVEFDNGAPLADNEYVVNTYIGPESYLADSLQLAVGEARIPESNVDDAAPVIGYEDPTAAPMIPQEPGAEQASFPEQVQEPQTNVEVPGGPSQWTLYLAIIGVLILAAVVLWAARSAMQS